MLNFSCICSFPLIFRLSLFLLLLPLTQEKSACLLYPTTWCQNFPFSSAFFFACFVSRIEQQSRSQEEVVTRANKSCYLVRKDLEVFISKSLKANIACAQTREFRRRERLGATWNAKDASIKKCRLLIYDIFSASLWNELTTFCAIFTCFFQSHRGLPIRSRH